MLICDDCEEAPATEGFDAEGNAVPVGHASAVRRFCEECVTAILEQQAGCNAGCE